jgi:glycosyltransferase involved in cell wall biosynthesis
LLAAEFTSAAASSKLAMMHIVQITPGAGAMYCGNCFRDNALVRELRGEGHEVTMVPLYLPLTLDEADESASTPIFFGGISVYLEQKSNFFQRTPQWLRRLLASRKILAWAGKRAAKTRASEVGDMMLSMLRGEEGRQARELDELIAWLKTQTPPDVICLSNALLVGLARQLKTELNAPIICSLQGEDAFLDGLPDSHREAAWQLLRERAADVDRFIAPSRYFGELMTRRLGLPPGKVSVVYNGIDLDGYEAQGLKPQSQSQSAPVLGYLARMSKEKGLDTLIEAFILLKQRGAVPRLKLQIGGSCGPGDEPFVKALRKRLAEAGYIGEVAFFPNLTRVEKIDFLRGLTVFSVPALYGEAFGLYLIEALAAGVPVVQPRHAAFPELVEATGGGVLCEPADAKSLADQIEKLLLNPAQARALGEAGQKSVGERFSVAAMTAATLRVFEIANPQSQT